MAPEEIFKVLSGKFGDKVQEVSLEAVDPVATVDASSLQEICTFLKTESELAFTSLMCLSSVDHDEENLRIVYHLDSIEKNHKVTLQVIVPKLKPQVPSVNAVWRTADWHEREAFDLMGIKFENHPDFRRILLPDDWEGYPLRKDYEVQEVYRGMQVPYPEDEEEKKS